MFIRSWLTTFLEIFFQFMNLNLIFKSLCLNLEFQMKPKRSKKWENSSLLLIKVFCMITDLYV